MKKVLPRVWTLTASRRSGKFFLAYRDTVGQEFSILPASPEGDPSGLVWTHILRHCMVGDILVEGTRQFQVLPPLEGV